MGPLKTTVVSLFGLEIPPDEETRLVEIGRKMEEAKDAAAELCVVRFRDALLVTDEVLNDNDLDELVRVIRQEDNRVSDILDKVTTALNA